MRNPIIGFCRVKDVQYNQFERDGDASASLAYEMGYIDESNFDTKEEYLKDYKHVVGCDRRNNAQCDYYNNYSDVSPHFGKVVPLSYDRGNYYIHPDGVSDTYNAQYEGIPIPLRWVDIIPSPHAICGDDGRWQPVGVLEEPGLMFRNTDPVCIDISEESICGIHYMSRLDKKGNVIDYGFISDTDLMEIYRNIGRIIGVKK